MTTGSILVAIALFMIVSVFILRPVLVERFRPIKADQTTTLIREKEQIISNIRALEFDFETGKLPETRFHSEREKLVVSAAVLLQKIDDLPNPDIEIEKAIQSIKKSMNDEI